MQYLNTDTVEIQNQLADYCRTGVSKNIPGITPNRIKHYRRLVTNIIRNTLSQAFPITLEVLPEEEWDRLVTDFFSQHKSTTPQIWKLPLEFVTFVKENRFGTKLNRPYLDDLLYFEWIEIEVHTMPDGKIPGINTNGDLLKNIPVFNPDHRLITLSYPVHLMPAEATVNKKGNYFLLVYRTTHDGSVHFLNLGLFHAVILEQMLANPMTLEQAVETGAQILNLQDINMLTKQGISFLKNLAEKKFLVGFRK